MLIKLSDPDDNLSPPVALGTSKEFLKCAARFNTAPDGGSAKHGTETLYGPGMLVELPLNQDEIRQALVSCYDQELAWPVLYGMCKAFGWKLQDMDTGQVFG